MFTWTRIFQIVLLSAVAGPGRVLAVRLLHYTCQEFGEGAYFDPYEAIDSLWKIFYFWGNTTEINPIMFSLPLENRVRLFREVVEAMEPELILDWHKATLLMEPRPGLLILLLYSATPGAFQAIVKMEDRKKERPYPRPEVIVTDVRLKLVDRYMGFMACEDGTAYALARVHEMPVTEKHCERGAASLGFQGPGGRSYLYVQNLTKRRMDDEL